VKNLFKNYWGIFTIAGVIVALDQWTKWLVRSNIPAGQSWLPESLQWLSPYARIVHWYNRGAAFGMFQEGGMVFTVLAFIVIAAIIYYYPQVSRADWPLRLAMSMQLGGALGNLIDRLTIGHVTDFLSVGTFPVFNVADASISIGCVVLLLGVWWQERAAKREKIQAAASDQPSEVTSE
jgi:signal peptidase II